MSSATTVLARSALLVATLALTNAPNAAAQNAKTPRDAYVEAWFKETAEADLAGALLLYKQCLDGAATSDRELAARALLRIARIAQARNDGDAAAGYLERLKKEFDGTLAAKEAAAGGDAGARAATESTEVIEARQWLDEILSKEEFSTPPEMANTVLRVLGLDEVLRVHAARGGRLSRVLGAASETALTQEQWLAMAVRPGADDNVLRAVLLKLTKSPPKAIPPELVERVSTSSWENHGYFVGLCLASGTDDALATLETFIRTRIENTPSGGGLAEPDQLFRHVASGDERHVRLVAAWLDGVDANKAPGTYFENVGLPASMKAVFESTPGAEVFWSRYPSWTLKARLRFSPEFNAQPPERVMKILRTDPEAQIRTRARAIDLASSDSAKRREAARAFESEAAPVETDNFQRVFDRLSAPPVEIFEETTGSLRELAYYECLMGKFGAATLAAGLRLGHREVLTALFDPRFDQDPRLQRGGSALPSYPSAFQVVNAQLAQQLEADPDSDLLRKAVAAGLALGDAEFGLTILQVLEKRPSSRTWSGFGEMFAAVGDPRVDLQLLEKSRFRSELTDDTMRRYLRHPMRDIRHAAIRACEKPELVAEIVESCELFDLDVIHGRAGERGFQGMYPVVLKRADPDSDVAIYAFENLLKRDGEGLIIACERGGDDRLGRVAIQAAACIVDLSRGRAGCNFPERHEFFSHIEIPNSVRSALREGQLDGDAALRAAVAKALRAHLAEWNAAVIEHEAKRIVTESQSEAPPLLAALGARDFAIRLLDHQFSQRRKIGVETLAGMGERDLVIEHARKHLDPEEWLRALLHVGADEEVVAQLRAGRVRAEDINALMNVAIPSSVVRELLLGANAIDLPQAWPNYRYYVSRFIDSLVEAKDVASLVELENRYPLGFTVNALFQLQAHNALLDLFVVAPRNSAKSIYDLMVALTGHAGSKSYDLRTERDELVAEWRKRLAK